MSERSCSLSEPDLPGIEVILQQTAGGVGDYRQARELAEAEASKRFAEFMLISWYDRERDLESPPHTSECAGCGPKSGYIHYARSRGARLKVEIDSGRFVFFFTPVEW